LELEPGGMGIFYEKPYKRVKKKYSKITCSQTQNGTPICY